MGGMWGAVGVMAALAERARTGLGQRVQSSLFENCAFLSAQNMQMFAVTGEPPAPMPMRKTPWAVYDAFKTAAQRPLFIAAASAGQWTALSRMLGHSHLQPNPELQTNHDPLAPRPRLIPRRERPP